MDKKKRGAECNESRKQVNDVVDKIISFAKNR